MKKCHMIDNRAIVSMETYVVDTDHFYSSPCSPWQLYRWPPLVWDSSGSLPVYRESQNVSSIAVECDEREIHTWN